MKPCRECRREISEQAVACPQCGVPYPARDKWDGYGYEYKSKAALFGLPLVHISFKYRTKQPSLPGMGTFAIGQFAYGLPVPAKGIVAIGQFACGFFTLSQFGIGIVSVSQFTIAGLALAQFAAAYSCVAQIGLYIHAGHGQLVKSLAELVEML